MRFVIVPGEAPLWQLPHLMATTLAPVDSREVVRCDHCLLVQFRTSNDLCRRCHASLDEEEPEIVAVAPAPQMMPSNGHGRGHLNLAASIRSLRLDRKSTRLNSSHLGISYAVFCLKKKN